MSVASILAIDFGTSNSTVGCPTPAGPRLIAVEGTHVTIPSAIFFNVEEECVQFGRSAIDAYTQHYEGRLLRALKSVLGSSLIDEATDIGGQQLAFKDVIASFIGHLKRKAEEQVGHAIDAVILGRPVWFVDNDPQRDRAAQDQLEAIARRCGFQHVDFQYEPIAAALDYEAGVGGEELALIADLGGGTADISIVRVSPARHLKTDRKGDVLANTGVHVGGTDYDRRLSLDQVMPLLGYKTHQRENPSRELPSAVYFDLATWHRIILLNGNSAATFLKDIHYMAARPDLVHRLLRVVREQTGHQLAGDVERAKIALSDRDRARMELPYVEADLAIELSRVGFESATAGETQKIADSIRECLRQAGVGRDAITTLFLTGGTSAVPSVRAACEAIVPGARVVAGDRFGSVGIGLTIHAGIRAGAA
ncbi:MAG: Hsp70 family protein [Rhodocyclales bacterium]|nr:Hsp70 family protein [Rhodocyclales bacterium]